MSLLDDLEAEVATRWADHSDGAHDIWHIRRVWASSVRIADALNAEVDRQVLMIAAYLHDIVNLPKGDPRSRDAAALSAAHAVAWMADRDLPGKAEVAHAIRGHSFSAGHPCETVEAQILQDADRLEALGAIGIARCFTVAGQMGAGIVHGHDPLAEARPLDDRQFALDHFETKLFAIAETLHTAPARAMAADRVALMRRFVRDLVAETRL